MIDLSSESSLHQTPGNPTSPLATLNFIKALISGSGVLTRIGNMLDPKVP